ncbi:uncharacterized protein LOC117148197 isoform X3 [Drosophila mauritiana]|uniref:Uncharacterized protein LOC117148197 isoform X3 n=1 Tax=Drosophila mauritiana TaxID=7226 RepID=A0A6P8L6G6_DROMA|nr:uncharacterized protein LOC117148197 isoform X3 [Drosophila mauritiana]
MSLPPEDTDLSTNSAHEYALQIGSNVSAVRVVGSAVGQRFSPSPEAHPNVIERFVSNAETRRSTIPSWENSPVAPSRSEEAAPNAAAAQLLWAENQGLATSHLLPTEPTFETLNTNAYSSPPGDSRFTFPNQNYSPLLPRCVPVPNQRYSPSGSPIHQLHELQNCPLIDSPLRLPPRLPETVPKKVPTPSISRTVDALIDLDQNELVIHYIQQYNNEPVLYQQNLGSGFHVYYQAPEDNQPIVLHIVEHNPQIITESQEQTNQIVPEIQINNIQEQTHQIVPEIQINNIQEQDQKLENGLPERNHPIVTEAQDQNQQTLTEIPEKCLQLASPVITDIQVQSPQDVIEIQEQNHQSVTKIQEEVHQTAPEIQVKIFEISSDIQEQNRQFVTEEQNHQTITEIQEDYLPIPAEIQEQDQDNNVTEVTELASPVVTDIHVQSPQCVIEIDDEDDKDLKFASGDQEQHLNTISEIHEKIQQSPQFVIEIDDEDIEDYKLASNNLEQHLHTIPETEEKKQQIANEFSEKILHLAPDISEHNQQTSELQKEGLQFDSEIEKRDLQIVTDTHKQNHQNVTEIQEESFRLTSDAQKPDQPTVAIEIQENAQFASDNQDQEVQTVTEIHELSRVQFVTDIQEHAQNLQLAKYLREQNQQITAEDQQQEQHYLNFPEIQEQSAQLASEFEGDKQKLASQFLKGNQQFPFKLQQQDQLSVPEIQKQSHQFESKVKKKKLQPFSEYQQKGQQLSDHIENRQIIQQEFTIHSNQENNSFEVQPANEVNEFQRDGELNIYPGRQYQNFVVEGATPLPHAEAQPGPQENNSFEVQPANEVNEFQRDGELNPGRQHQNFVVEGATPLPHAEAQPGPQENSFEVQPANEVNEFQRDGELNIYPGRQHQNFVVEGATPLPHAEAQPGPQENSFEVQPANEVNEFQRDGELNIYPGRQHQNFVVEGATPLPHAEAQPGPTPEDISDSVSLEHGEPNTICIRNTFQLIREISDSLVADPEQPEAANHRLSLYLLRKKLADVCHKVLTEAIQGRATDQCITILREILEQTKELRPRPQRPTKDIEFQKEISMGLEILKKIRGMLSGWYTSRESETDSRETGTGFQAQNGKGRGAGRQPENSYLSQKRRNQEENPRLVKYRRVDNSFPRLITNETAEDLIPNNSMAERDKPQSSKRLSIFNPPVYTQHRVRNEAPYIPTPFDDEESSQRFANAGPSSRPMTYSDAVRLGQNGIAESRVNGHSSHSVRSASARVQGSILLHEINRKDQEQYTDLIRTAAQSNSMGSRCVKPGTPPTFQRAKAQSATGSGYYLLHDNQSNIRNSHPPSHGHANRELTEYAKLISRQDENRAPTPQQPKRNASNSSASHSSTTSSSGSSCSTCSTCSTSSDSEPKSAKDSSEVKEAKEANETNKTNETNVTMKIEAPQPQPQPQPPTRLTKIGSLQQRFANCVFLRDDFAETFKARAIRRQGASMHLLGIAKEQASVSTDERIAYEKKLREIMFRSGTPHRPFFEIGPVDQPDENNETKFISLTQEHYVRFRELTTSPITKNVIFKYNLQITTDDMFTFSDGEWLNDVIINFYMSMLTERSEKRAGELPAVYAMNTFFMPRLLQAGYSGVKRWTRKVDLFSKEIIPVPVHCGNVHWCMAIINLPKQTIHYYDSMGRPNQPVLDALVNYLKAESLDKRYKPLNVTGFVVEHAQNIPRQGNSSDCGVFSCMFAEYITRNAPITFSQAEMPYFRKKMAMEIAGGELWQ